MFGQNVTRGHDYDQRKDALDVVAIFPTIQGEGPLAGTPAVFVRLAHCNLKCWFCDTQFEEGAETLTHDEVVQRVRDAAGENVRLVVVTGGEPFRQPLRKLTRYLVDLGYRVQFETAGSLQPHPADEDADWVKWYAENRDVCVVISPKTPTLAPAFQELAECNGFGDAVALKYIIHAGSIGPSGLPMASTQKQGPGRPPWSSYNINRSRIFLQPMDEHDEERTRANVQATIDACRAHGYRLSLQLHKIVGLP